MVVSQVRGENLSNGKKSRGNLNMIDLAGSERISKSGASGQALKEAACVATDTCHLACPSSHPALDILV